MWPYATQITPECGLSDRISMQIGCVHSPLVIGSLVINGMLMNWAQVKHNGTYTLAFVPYPPNRLVLLYICYHCCLNPSSALLKHQFSSISLSLSVAPISHTFGSNHWHCHHAGGICPSVFLPFPDIYDSMFQIYGQFGTLKIPAIKRLEGGVVSMMTDRAGPEIPISGPS